MTIFVAERNGYVDIFKTVSDAESWMESIDIEQREYSCAYDEEGNVFEIHSRGTKKGWFGLLSPSTGLLKPTGTKNPKELYDLLHRQFGNSRESVSLQDLVRLAEKEILDKK